MRRLFAIACLVLLSTAARAETTFNGAFTQGGVVFGRTDPGSRLVLDDIPVKVDEDGVFVFGFHRDAPATSTLTITAPDGSAETRTLDVAPRDFKIQRIDGLPENMVTPPQEVLDRIRRDQAEVAAARAADRPETDFRSGFIWPAKGPISGVYGSQRILNGQPRQPHYGIDIAAPKGTAVVAPADGLVTLAATDHYYTGGTLILDHGHGLSSTFIHMDSVAVKVGEHIRQGTVIGTIGATGRATGPHLDWRMNWYDRRLDPAFVVPPMPTN
ncbi:M23 family metallopeptidase [Thalassobaculum salexigens]|uniref:M23 family metallopeptidase n=1 Tax=Thalassobaculum salexigens TaxID=455360 RepID=UPI0004241971|nr:M23 family metallopeptidase [Thalassobaculum salexigens]